MYSLIFLRFKTCSSATSLAMSCSFRPVFAQQRGDRSDTCNMWIVFYISSQQDFLGSRPLALYKLQSRHNQKVRNSLSFIFRIHSLLASGQSLYLLCTVVACVQSNVECDVFPGNLTAWIIFPNQTCIFNWFHS